MTVTDNKSNTKVSYRNALKFSRENNFRNRQSIRIGYNKKQNNKQKKYQKKGDYTKGMDSTRFDEILNKDINYYSNRYENAESKSSSNIETNRRLNLIKV